MKKEIREAAYLSILMDMGISRKSLKMIIKVWGSFEVAFKAAHNEIQLLDIDHEDKHKLFWDRDERKADLCLEKCQREGIALITLGSEEYPLLLKEISSPPYFLFLKGNPNILSSRCPVAVVGTRLISDYGQRVLQKMIPVLVRAGATIISGLAFGVDGLAHKIALEHGGKCIAVLGNGVDLVYPGAHRSLAQRILNEGGVIISEQALSVKPLAQFFPARNRIISGLAKSTIIIEAKERSGSLITAQFALEQNRDVFAVPGNIFTENQQGTNQLIAEGAYPLISEESLLTQLNLSIDTSEPAAQELSFDSDEEKMIYEYLRDPRSLDQLSLESSLPSSKVSQLITMMELKGVVRNLGGMRYGRS